jgi:hypothetical protein
VAWRHSCLQTWSPLVSRCGQITSVKCMHEIWWGNAMWFHGHQVVIYVMELL